MSLRVRVLFCFTGLIYSSGSPSTIRATFHMIAVSGMSWGYHCTDLSQLRYCIQGDCLPWR